LDLTAVTWAEQSWAGGGVQGGLWLGEGVSVSWSPHFPALFCRGRFLFRLPHACLGASRLSDSLRCEWGFSDLMNHS